MYLYKENTHCFLFLHFLLHSMKRFRRSPAHRPDVSAATSSHASARYGPQLETRAEDRPRSPPTSAGEERASAAFEATLSKPQTPSDEPTRRIQSQAERVCLAGNAYMAREKIPHDKQMGIQNPKFPQRQELPSVLPSYVETLFTPRSVLPFLCGINRIS